MLKRFKVNSKIYNSIIEKSKAAFHFTEGYDVDVSGSSARIYYDNGFMTSKETTILNHITGHPEKDCLIIEAAMYTYYTGEKITGLNYWQQFILMDGGNDIEKLKRYDAEETNERFWDEDIKIIKRLNSK